MHTEVEDFAIEYRQVCGIPVSRTTMLSYTFSAFSEVQWYAVGAVK